MRLTNPFKRPLGYFELVLWGFCLSMMAIGALIASGIFLVIKWLD